jgi:hypothetical protein
MQPPKVVALLLSALLALALGAAPARAETVNCTAITSVPTIITVQGIYCFTGHLATAITSGNAIDIQTNNVIVDLNGFKLGGLAAGAGTTAIGIHALDRQNVTIKNGTVRGYLRGIQLETAGASQGHIVEDIRADLNKFVGIEVDGAGNIVRNNQVVTTGGSTTFGANASANGILILGSGARVLNNDIINTFKAGTGTATGINFSGATGAFAVNNRITTADRGIDYNSGATGKYRDNLTFGVTSPFTGTGTAVGTND